MNTNRLVILTVLTLSIAAVATGTAATGLVLPAFAGGEHDHHDHGDKKCKDNGDNNCNDKHNTQKIKTKNECEIENTNKDHSKDNENLNGLACVSQNANVRDSLLVNSDIFGSAVTDGLGCSPLDPRGCG
jgi:hypothetical protein